MAPPAEKVLSDLGKRLAHTPQNKDSLVKLLRKAADALSELKQASSLQPAIEPLSDSLVRHSLLQHRDKDVRLLVAVCFTEIIRLLAPNPPYSDDILKDIFKLLVSMFAELADTTSVYFSRRVKILHTVAALQCCVIMLDIGCEDLVLEMFNVFFSVVREDNQQSLLHSMLSIITLILDEKVSQPLLDVILRNLLKEEKGVPPASYRLAVSVIQNCTEKLQPFVRGFLTSSILDQDVTGSELKESYHEIIFEIFQYAPKMLADVLPNLTHELLTDQVDVRIKAVHLVGKIFALSGRHLGHEYRQLFVEFLKRFSDKSVEVRVSSLGCAKAFLIAHPSGTESIEVLTALEGRLLDFDEKVRAQAVDVICELAKYNPKFIRSDLILQVTERLRDKKVSVRKFSMQKLLELYRAYANKCSEGLLTLNDHFEQIPCRILALCYDKDCLEFRPQNMELVLAEDLFPTSISVQERISHWLYFFSFFTLPHIKALNSILSQKRRLQTEMQAYLALRENEKENVSDEVDKKVLNSFRKMSASFVDPSKAEVSFKKLHQMKDKSIFKALFQLLDEGTAIVTAQTIRDTLLKRIGEKHPHYEFLRILALKSSHAIFSAEHVQCILLELLSGKNAGNNNLKTAGIDLLLTVVDMFPSLLKGSEDYLLKYFSVEGNQLNEKLLQVIARAGSHISIKLSDIYPSLEWACFEGTRVQSKYSISAMAALTDASDELALSELYKKLVDSLHDGRNIPTVLQSLGCIAQYSVPTYESREVQSHEQTDPDDGSGCSTSCRLQIYGLKTLVKSYLPHRITHVRHKIKVPLNILLRLLSEHDISDGIMLSEIDKAHVRLAAAKSVLRLARRWDLHISPQIFHLTVLKARDPSPVIRRSFLGKLNKVLKERAIPNRYACAFAFTASDCLIDSMKYLAEFIKEYGREARIRQTRAVDDSEGETMMNYPEYILVFLIHVLAHDVGFPSGDTPDNDAYARFCRPLVVMLQALVNPAIVDHKKNDVDDTISYILSIFRAIKKAKDAVDVCMTPKLHILSDIGVLIVKALSDKFKSLSHTARMVFLPSSFYKVSCDTENEEENLNFRTVCSFDRSSIEMLLHMFEPNSVRPTSPHTKRSRKLQDDSTHSAVIKNGTKYLPKKTREERDNSDVFGKEARKAVRQQLNTGGKNKPVLLATTSQSVELPLEGSIYELKHGAPNSAESGPGKDQLSSCGSVVTKPSHSSSQVATKEVEIISSSSLVAELTNFSNSTSPSEPTDFSKHGVETHRNSKEVEIISSGSLVAEPTNFSNSISPTEPTHFSKHDPETHRNSKVLGDMSEVLVGHRIKLWSPIDKCFQSGTIHEFDSQNSTHKITYDNGEVERLCLANEDWEVISNSSLLGKGPSKFLPKERECQQGRLTNSAEQSKLEEAEPSAYCDFEMGSSGCLEEAVETFGLKVAQQQTVLSEKRNGNLDKETISSVMEPCKGKRKGALKPSVSAKTNAKSGSEVINENTAVIVRRTRRRKV
ncbi:ARM repeat superfamily protein isoform X2 [Tasmannia lanceolata]|uniref:ARM repeat superfamily protein isoform X2 n=1 Tax=Tasmannia lanceolata TaxID=3420 RepID=UPI00406495C9